MMRTRLFTALATAAVLVLGACSSTDGSGTPAEQPSDSADSGSPSAPVDDSSADDTGGTDGSAAEEPEDSTADTSESDAAGDSGSEDDAAGSTVTLSGDLDAQTAAWFTTFCTGLSEPMTAMIGAMMGAAFAGLSTGDDDTGTTQATPEQLRTAIVTSMNQFVSALEGTAGELSDMPPPTIKGGEALAKSVVDSGQLVGAAYQQMIDELSNADVSSMDAFSAAMQKIMADAEDTVDELPVASFDFDPEIKKDIAKLPACEGMLMFNAPM